MSATRNDLAIALRFAARHNLFHVSALVDACYRVYDGHSMDCERFIRDLTRMMKDEAAFELWPVYERPGWWTTIPSEEVRRVAVHEAFKRNLTEQSRWLGALHRFRRGTFLEGVVLSIVGLMRGQLTVLQTTLPEPDREDFCLERIDALIALGETYS